MMKTKTRSMISDVLSIAEREGLCDDSLGRRLVIQLANRKGTSWGGRRKGEPFVSFAMKSIVWEMTPSAEVDNVLEHLKILCASDPSAKRRRALRRLGRVAQGECLWSEYASISSDLEIGDLYGDADDVLKPLAALICHELAHVIDYNCGELEIAGRKYDAAGSGHGKKWQAIYRVLRNAYVASGAYRPAPVAEIIELKPKPKTTMPPELIGLPLFDIAA